MEPQWSDEHDLVSVEFDEYGAWDKLEQELQTGVAPNDWTRNESTVFSCEPGFHFDPGGGPLGMTYAFAVRDVDGNPADCLAFGHDVAGMKGGTYVRMLEPSFSLADCAEGEPMR